MRTSSAKAKGRKLVDTIIQMYKDYFNLTDNEIYRPTTSQPGADIKFFGKGRDLNHSVECKNVEKLNVWKAWDQTLSHKGPQFPIKTDPVLFISKNRIIMPLAVITAEYFMELVQKAEKYDAIGEKYE